ncbi:MAG: Calvin cycle protein CP12 [Elainellaceae cyanobacterium]
MAQIVYTSPAQGFKPFIIPQQPKTLDESIHEARNYARMISEISGTMSPEAAVAWDSLEELLAAKAHRKIKVINPFTEYCNRYPDAPEARMYDV